jgi:PAS domain S-box-containing protein
MSRHRIFSAFSQVWIAWLLLQAGVIATAIVTLLVVRDAQTTRSIELETAADEIVETIDARMRAYVEVVYAVRGLFAGTRTVLPAEFDRFVTSLELPQRYPGMQTIVFAPRVPAGERAAFERSARESGGAYRDFAITPAGPRNEYFPVLFRVRFRTGSAPLGFDIAADPERSAISQITGDGAALAALGPVPLRSDPQNHAYFLFLPVYRAGAAITTREERERALRGVVRANIRVEDLVTTVSRGARLPPHRFAVFDVVRGGASESAKLLYDSRGKAAAGEHMDGSGEAISTRLVRFGGHAWRVVVEPPPRAAHAVWLAPLSAGLTISVLLFALVLSLARASRRARVLAEHTVRKLRATEMRIAKTEEFSSVMVLHAGLDSRLLKVPPTFCRLMAYDEDDLLTRRIEDLIHPQQGLAWRRQLRELTEGCVKSADCEIRCMCGNGGEVWLALSCLLVSDDDDLPVHLLVYARDVTARVQANNELRQLHAGLERQVEQRTAQLQAANRELESFSYSVSHDLRASVRHISGFARMLETELPPLTGETARRHLARIAAAAGRMGELIDDLLFFARATRAELRLNPLDMDHAVQRALDELAPELAARDVRFNVATMPTAVADRSLMHQVWVNLLSNAIKYTARREHAVVEVGSHTAPSGEQVYFVRDNGVGFEQTSAHRLFGVFQRLHTREEFEGTGIGLATVQRIVHRHGGRVWAEGVAGEGATFYFSLPREPKEAEPEFLARSA